MTHALKTTSSCLLHLVKCFQKQVEAIKELQEYLFVLERGMLASEGKISSLVKAKDDAIVEFVKVVNQIKDRDGFIKGQDDTILKLCQQLDAITLQVLDLCLHGNNTKDVVIAELEQNNLQRKLDSHALMADTFKNLLAMADANHATILKNNSKAQEAWKRVANKMDVWKQQKSTLCTQI